MSRRRQLQFIYAQIRAEMQDRLTKSVLIAFSVYMAFDLVLRGLH